jgi:uncharacterized membrane protein YccC
MLNIISLLLALIYALPVHFLLILSFWVTFMESITTLLSWVEANSTDEEADIVWEVA